MKPPYSIPSMRAIARRRGSNGLTVVSTFSGCGGSCLGFEWAGFRVVWASEFIEAAAETYRANHPGVPLDRRDIREVSGDQIREATGLDSFDVLEGSPPCASFSTAGARERHWGKVKKYSDGAQRTDDLFFEYVRLLGELMPRAFVAENVSGLTMGVSRGYFNQIHRALAGVGYRVEARVLDAQWLGVPQVRKRVIFVGVRNDLDRAPAFPAPLPYRYSIKDALPHLAAVVQGDGGKGLYGQGEVRQSAERPAPTVTMAGMGGKNRYCAKAEVRGGTAAPHQNKGKRFSLDAPIPTVVGGGKGSTAATNQFVVEQGLSFEGYAIEQEWERLKPGETSKRYLNLVRPDPDRPVPTVTQTGGIAGAASVTHPVERRKFSIPELRALCGFPADFILTGTFSQQWERLGRAVPPPMMRAVAETLRDEVLS